MSEFERRGVRPSAAPSSSVPPVNSSPRPAAVVRLGVWLVALALGTALFHTMGDGPLSAPPLDPGAWSAWAAGRDPLVATFAVMRLVVLGLSWYLVGATSIGILARLLRAARLVALADALTIPALRRLLQGTLGVSLATAMVVASVPTVAPAGAHASAVTGLATADHDVSVVLAAQGDGDRVTLEHVGPPRPLPLELLDRTRDRVPGAADVPGASDVPGAPDGSGPAGPSGEARTPGTAVDGTQTRADAREHLVVAGESFWSIAEDRLAGQRSAAPTDAELVEYWHALIDANRDRLVDPDNPDLIFPGQTLTLPGDVGSNGGVR